MKAVRLLSPKNLVLREIPDPIPGNTDVLVRVKYVGICGTDYSIYTGSSSFVKSGKVNFPLTLGHEWSGIVYEIGPGVTDYKLGDRVVGDTAVSCGHCYECLRGNYMCCEHMHPVGTVNAIDGAYAEYIKMPERHLFALPDNVSFKQGALVEPASLAMSAILHGGMKQGDTVLIQGTGPIGLAAVCLAKLSGAAMVILSGRTDSKLAVGTSLGADAVINIRRENLHETVLSLTGGRGPHLIIEASGAVSSLKDSFALVRLGGVISLIAFYEGTVDGVDFDGLILKNASLVSIVGTPVSTKAVLELMGSGRLDLSSIITHEYPLDNVIQAMDVMENKQPDRIKILLKV